ncbi:hypothetical protein PilKf_02236 [Pillotina sp. SPG140]
MRVCKERLGEPLFFVKGTDLHKRQTSQGFNYHWDKPSGLYIATPAATVVIASPIGWLKAACPDCFDRAYLSRIFFAACTSA